MKSFGSKVKTNSKNRFTRGTGLLESQLARMLAPSPESPDILWHPLNLNVKPQLAYENAFFSVVTMLAVVEDLNRLILVFRNA